MLRLIAKKKRNLKLGGGCDGLRATRGYVEQEMERVAQETMDKAMTYQNELENQKASGQKQVGARPALTAANNVKAKWLSYSKHYVQKEINCCSAKKYNG